MASSMSSVRTRSWTAELASLREQQQITVARYRLRPSAGAVT
ncbi:MAG: hypothetical protein JWO11_2049 [Nocardioides sp.]|nr:hypothetical protein [Nocardioides sp.]